MIGYLGVLIYFSIGTLLGVVMVVLNSVISPQTKALSLEKISAYECGFDPFGEARTPFDVGFYLVAILFLVFDIEVAFLLPWAIGGASTGIAGFIGLSLFLIVLTLGFVFEWQKGALEWNSELLQNSN